MRPATIGRLARLALAMLRLLRFGLVAGFRLTVNRRADDGRTLGMRARMPLHVRQHRAEAFQRQVLEGDFSHGGRAYHGDRFRLVNDHSLFKMTSKKT